jgi:hypothetical protein
MIADTGVFEYEAMVERYSTALFQTLRHHQAPGDLDTWVPDADPLRGILNVVEAAEIAGRASIAIRVGSATLAELDVDELAARLAELGHVDITRSGDGMLIAVEAIGGRTAPAAAVRSSDVFGGIGAAYRDAVRAAAGSISHEGTLDVPHDAASFAAARDGVTLEVAIDERHAIRAAAHRGAVTRGERAILDRLCAILGGLTVQEAHDHAAIRLEHALRDPAARRPVPGIVAPENADPAFARPARLIRDVVKRYAATTGFRLGENRFTPRPSERWLALDRDGRLAALSAAAEHACPELGLAPGQIRIVDVESPVKATVAFHDDVDAHRKPQVLMQLERRLHAIEPALALYSVELRDANKTRRL